MACEGKNAFPFVNNPLERRGLSGVISEPPVTGVIDVQEHRVFFENWTKLKIVYGRKSR